MGLFDNFNGRLPRGKKGSSVTEQEKKDLKIVEKEPLALQYIKNQTPEICMAAVQGCGLALCHVREQTPAICMAAVQQDGMALEFVKEQTSEICLTAVRQNGYALKYVEKQTPEICIAAIRQCGYALLYVKDQTEEICMAAVRQYPYAIQYIGRDKGTSKGSFADRTGGFFNVSLLITQRGMVKCHPPPTF